MPQCSNGPSLAKPGRARYAAEMIVLIALALYQIPPAAPPDHGPDVSIQQVQEDDLFQLHYSWPPAIISMPLLRAELGREMERQRIRGTRFARGARAQARREDFPFSPHTLSVIWRLEGRTPQLVSLSAETGAWRGGGHSEDGYDSMLWDATRNRRIDAHALFRSTAITRRFCAAYPNALNNHLGTGALAQDDPRWNCPALGRRPLAPADTDGNGRFDTLRVFMAVNYFEAEGYSVDVPIEPSDIARIPAELRPAFEVAGERSAPLPAE